MIREAIAEASLGSSPAIPRVAFEPRERFLRARLCQVMSDGHCPDTIPFRRRTGTRYAEKPNLAMELGRSTLRLDVSARAPPSVDVLLLFCSAFLLKV